MTGAAHDPTSNYSFKKNPFGSRGYRSGYGAPKGHYGGQQRYG